MPWFFSSAVLCCSLPHHTGVGRVDGCWRRTIIVDSFRWGEKKTLPVWQPTLVQSASFGHPMSSNAFYWLFYSFFVPQVRGTLTGVHQRFNHSLYLCMCLHVCVCVFWFVEPRWATACCSAVTAPALACIIYLPADRSGERHNHSNQRQRRHTQVRVCRHTHTRGRETSVWMSRRRLPFA